MSWFGRARFVPAVVLWLAVVAAGIRARMLMNAGEPWPAWLTVVMLVIAGGFAIERSVVLVRAMRRPCRRPVDLTSHWGAGLVALASLLAIGLWGLLDRSSSNWWVFLAMLLTGVVAALLTRWWLRKPVRDEKPRPDDGGRLRHSTGSSAAEASGNG